jgi:hypothetical protein
MLKEVDKLYEDLNVNKDKLDIEKYNKLHLEIQDFEKFLLRCESNIVCYCTTNGVGTLNCKLKYLKLCNLYSYIIKHLPFIEYFTSNKTTRSTLRVKLFDVNNLTVYKTELNKDEYKLFVKFCLSLMNDDTYFENNLTASEVKNDKIKIFIGIYDFIIKNITLISTDTKYVKFIETTYNKIIEILNTDLTESNIVSDKINKYIELYDCDVLTVLNRYKDTFELYFPHLTEK